jgi:5-methylcytosine-specific restriction endonuclease McrA
VDGEKFRKNCRSWRRKNSEQVKSYNHEWRQKHPKYHIERYWENPKLYRERRKAWNTDIKGLFEQQDGLCFYCGELLYSSFDKEVHIEHKTPISRGGTSDISNLVLSCSACNFAKHTKTAEEFLLERGEALSR